MPLTPSTLLGLTGAAYLSGTITSISLISIPAITHNLSTLSLPASHAAKLWRSNFESGFRLAPPIAVVTAGSLLFAGWSAGHSGSGSSGSGSSGRDARLLFVAAALTVGIVPFTILFMGGTNERLLALAGKGELTGGEGGEVRRLLGKWMVLNGVRGLLPLVGAVVVGFVGLA